MSQAQLLMTVPKTVVQAVEVPMQVYEMVITRGAQGEPGRFLMWLRPLDGEAWDHAVSPIPVKVVDSATDPKDHKATDMRSMILDAVVPADHPLGLAYGVAGKTVREAGVAIIAMLQAPTPAPAPDPPAPGFGG